MGDEQIRVNSESWTGKMPSPSPPNPQFNFPFPSKAIAAIVMLASLVVWAPWQIYSGLSGREMIVPFIDGAGPVTKADGAAFDYAIFECVVLFEGGLFFTIFVMKLLLSAIRASQPQPNN